MELNYVKACVKARQLAIKLGEFVSVVLVDQDTYDVARESDFSTWAANMGIVAEYDPVGDLSP